jgi:L-lactate dehydrogenase complex protein LldG
MSQISDSRQEILSRIRGPHAASDKESAARGYGAIGRAYDRAGSLNAEQRLELLEERLTEYDARVHRVTASALPDAIAAAIDGRGAKRIAVPSDTPVNWFGPSLTVTEANMLSNLELDRFDGFVSGCTVAIALTGTIVLQNAPGQGPRKLSLIPDYHLCVVFADQIVETVSEAFDRLAATSTLPTTFISGPSATADIEMTRIKGVHGPRFLDVLIVY